jgi:3-hydroxyisobutyrate dehydrogenase
MRDDHERSVEMRVAVLGTGIMGAPMARNIAAAGHDVVVWNRTRDRAEATGLPVAGSPAEALEGADVLVTMLHDLDAVHAALAGVDLGRVAWMQSSTVGLEVGELATLGGRLVDAPVLGSRKPAEEGALTVFLAGPAEARDAVRPVADAVAAKVVDVGDRVGDATRLKLVMNLWVFFLTESTAELLALADAAGVEPRLVLETLRGGSLDSGYLQAKGAMILEQSFEPQFKLESALKDTGLIRELADRSGIALPLLEATAARFAHAVRLGHGTEDMAATWFARGEA